MARDGYKFVLPLLIAGIVAAGAGSRIAAAVLLILCAGVAFFFRDPERLPPSDVGAVVSPADGRITDITEESFAGRPGRRISVFLSIWDVHVNRSPMGGVIREVEYRPGRFYNAMRSRASADNEQNVIHLQTERGEMVFKQIAGAIARRVVCWKVPGDRVKLGERIGLIRFGSRMDLWLPNEAEIVARPGQHVSGGLTVLARWR
ncbi:MAG TPA: phosphatidylserine decarboxylase [Candidatus Acidoferrales bacterium]|nr:phosphatidylserine decarboxylase [Candidatus Acidoferrales bacterium]